MVTIKSRIKDVYDHPIGRDVLDKILMQMGRSSKCITNPLIGSLRLSSLKAVLSSKLGHDFFDTFLALNSEPDKPRTDKVADATTWWEEAFFYQIYPISFQDSNESGLGEAGMQYLCPPSFLIQADGL